MAQPRGIGTAGAGAPVLPHGRHGLSPVGRVKAARLAARSAQFMTPLQQRRQAPTTASAFAQALHHQRAVPALLLPMVSHRAATTLHESLLRRYTPTRSSAWYRGPGAASSTHLYTLLAAWYGRPHVGHFAYGEAEDDGAEPWAASVAAMAADAESVAPGAISQAAAPAALPDSSPRQGTLAVTHQPALFSHLTRSPELLPIASMPAAGSHVPVAAFPDVARPDTGGAANLAGRHEGESPALPATALLEWSSTGDQPQRSDSSTPAPRALVPAALNPLAAARAVDALGPHQGARLDAASSLARPQSQAVRAAALASPFLALAATERLAGAVARRASGGALAPALAAVAFAPGMAGAPWQASGSAAHAGTGDGPDMMHAGAIDEDNARVGAGLLGGTSAEGQVPGAAGGAFAPTLLGRLMLSPMQRLGLHASSAALQDAPAAGTHTWAPETLTTAGVDSAGTPLMAALHAESSPLRHLPSSGEAPVTLGGVGDEGQAVAAATLLRLFSSAALPLPPPGLAGLSTAQTEFPAPMAAPVQAGPAGHTHAAALPVTPMLLAPLPAASSTERRDEKAPATGAASQPWSTAAPATLAPTAVTLTHIGASAGRTLGESLIGRDLGAGTPSPLARSFRATPLMVMPPAGVSSGGTTSPDTPTAGTVEATEDALFVARVEREDAYPGGLLAAAQGGYPGAFTAPSLLRAMVPAALNPLAAARTADALMLNQDTPFDGANRLTRPQSQAQRAAALASSFPALAETERLAGAIARRAVGSTLAPALGAVTLAHAPDTAWMGSVPMLGRGTFAGVGAAAGTIPLDTAQGVGDTGAIQQVGAGRAVLETALSVAGFPTSIAPAAALAPAVMPFASLEESGASGAQGARATTLVGRAPLLSSLQRRSLALDEAAATPPGVESSSQRADLTHGALAPSALPDVLGRAAPPLAQQWLTSSWGFMPTSVAPAVLPVQAGLAGRTRATTLPASPTLLTPPRLAGVAADASALDAASVPLESGASALPWPRGLPTTLAPTAAVALTHIGGAAAGRTLDERPPGYDSGARGMGSLAGLPIPSRWSVPTVPSRGPALHGDSGGETGAWPMVGDSAAEASAIAGLTQSVAPFTGLPAVVRLAAAVQRKAEPATFSLPAIQQRTLAVARATQGTGAPLEGPARRALEMALGADLGALRVHTSMAAGEAAAALGARAFTLGQDVYFAQGAFQPMTAGGMSLLGHEAVHTLQRLEIPQRSALPGFAAAGVEGGERPEMEAQAGHAEATLLRLFSASPLPAATTPPALVPDVGLADVLTGRGDNAPPQPYSATSTTSPALQRTPMPAPMTHYTPGSGLRGSEPSYPGPSALSSAFDGSVMPLPPAFPVQRATEAVPALNGHTPAGTAQHESQAAAAGQGAPTIDDLTEQVFNRVQRQLALEHERAGGFLSDLMR